MKKFPTCFDVYSVLSKGVFSHLKVFFSENLNIILKPKTFRKIRNSSNKYSLKNYVHALFFCWVYKNLSLLVSNFQIILVVVAILFRDVTMGKI